MRLVLSIGLALLSAACATTNPQGSFDAASQPVRERTGLETAWPRSAAESEQLLAQSRKLLAQPLTAESAAQVALLRNPGLFAELEELGISQAEYAQATRISNPSLELSARRPNESGLATNVEASLLQDLLDPLLLPLRKRLAAAELEQAKLAAGQALLDLIAETKTAFAEHQAALRLAGRLGVIVEIEAAAVAFAERQRQAGNLPELELLEHQALLAETRAEQVHAEIEARAARERLHRLMGLAGSELGWTAAEMTPEPPDDPLTGDDLEAVALAARLDVATARAAIGLVEQALSLERANRFFPGGVHVGISREREPDRLRVTGPVLELELPIFDTGAASIARLEAEHRRAQRQLEALTLLVGSEVRELADRYGAARDLARFYRETALPGRVRILEETLRHYNAMLVGVYDLLMAKRLEIEAEHAAIEAWRDAWVTRFALERALGGRLPAPPAHDHHQHHDHHDHHAPGGRR